MEEESTDFSRHAQEHSNALAAHLVGPSRSSNGNSDSSWGNGSAAATPTTDSSKLIPSTDQTKPSSLSTELRVADRRNDDVEDEANLKFYCGIGSFRPRFLRIFSNAKFFTFLLCVYAFIQGSVVSGFTSVILSSIERRYQFSSTQAGLIAVTYDITVTVTVIFISYFGGRSHKPRFLGVSLLIMGCGTFIFASPQFLFGRYDVGSSNQTIFESCNNDSSHPPVDGDCSAGNIAAYVMFLIGNIFVGIGAAPLYTVGQAYVDEIVHPHKVSLYIGSFHVCAVVGPALGYGVGSGLLSVYVDPWEPTSLDESDPSWVGAWWLPFILMGICAFLLSIPFFMFPRYLIDSELVKKERAKEMAKVYDDDYIFDNKLTLMVKTFPVHIKRLFGNASFMLVSFGSALSIIMSSGMVSFAPKYVETQFGVPSSSAGLVVGAVGIFGAGLGVLSGALMIYCLKLKGPKIAFLIFVLVLVTSPFTFTFLLYCQPVDVVGITAPYVDGTLDNLTNASCAMSCGCTSTVFDPVCGADNLTYFSPCFAGCLKTYLDDGVTVVFENCSCVAESLANSTAPSSFLYSSELLLASDATSGRCPIDCLAIYGFLLLLTCTMILVFNLDIPYSVMTLRVVSEEQRTLALGLQSSIWRIFGTIPGPLLFGLLFDLSCEYWQFECGRRGNCWVYNNRKLGLSAMSVSIASVVVSCILFFFAWLAYPKRKVPRSSDSSNSNSSVHSNQSPAKRPKDIGLKLDYGASNVSPLGTCGSEDILLEEAVKDGRLASTTNDIVSSSY